MLKVIENTARAIWRTRAKPLQALRRASVILPGSAKPQEALIPIASILRSGEAFIPSAQYARLIGEPLRASTPAVKGPHVEFLKEYLKEGDAIFQPDRFQKTWYYRNAEQCISYTGAYFDYIRRKEDIVEAAKSFVAAFNGQRPERHRPEWGHNTPDELIEVRPILDSDCFELVHGNHRLASCFVKGKQTVKVRVLRQKVTTPAQAMLKDVLWQNNRVELYQPVELPELRGWPLVRKCSDRLAMMMRFLQDKNLSGCSYLDVGSSYGWFVKSFSEAGFSAAGVERDSFAIKVGILLYGLPRQSFVRSDIYDFLQTCEATYDIVSCFSVAHHFAMGKGPVDAGELIRRLDRITGSVMFFDTGQSHEQWFKEMLPCWDDSYVEKFLRDNSSFRTIQRIGRDEDDHGNFAGNFGRTLFACSKS